MIVMSEQEPELDLGLEPVKESVVEQEEPAKEDGIEELRRQLEAEKASRIAAEEAARKASTEAAKAKVDVDDTNMQLLKSAAEQIKKDKEDLKNSYAYALRQGDFAKAAEVQEQMIKLAQNETEIENGINVLKNKPKVSSEEEQTEKFINSLSPRSASWIREHKEYIRNPELNRKMLLAHAVAVDDGHVVDSDSYFDAIERRLGLKKAPVPVEEDALSEASAPVKRRDSAPAAAPVSRQGAPGEKPRVVRLSPEERDIAESLGMNPEEYARNKAELIKQGRMN